LARKRTTVPFLPVDARAQRSVKALRTAFLELIEHKPLEQILLRDITEAAGVSYPTFFRRFASKEDLLIDISRDEVRELLRRGEEAMVGSGTIAGAPMCEYVEQHRKLWKTLLTGGATAAMREEFMLAAKEASDRRPRINPTIPLELAVSFTTSGIFEIFSWWMRQPDDYPVGNIVKLVDSLVVYPIGRSGGISLD
jgi:AcrR family transcriptional regulator